MHEPSLYFWSCHTPGFMVWSEAEEPQWAKNHLFRHLAVSKCPAAAKKCASAASTPVGFYIEYCEREIDPNDVRAKNRSAPGPRRAPSTHCLKVSAGVCRPFLLEIFSNYFLDGLRDVLPHNPSPLVKRGKSCGGPKERCARRLRGPGCWQVPGGRLGATATGRVLELFLLAPPLTSGWDDGHRDGL